MKILQGADLNNKQIKNIAEPTDDTDAATKKYIDDAIDNAVITGGGTVLTDYQQISDLDNYPNSFPTDVDDINGLSASGKAILEANSAQSIRNAIELGNVNNTSDIDKPISNQTQAALDLKANTESPTFTGTVSGISKEMVGLGNVDNTSDASKPLSTAATTALAGKADSTDLDALDDRVEALENTPVGNFILVDQLSDIPDGTPSGTIIGRLGGLVNPDPVTLAVLTGSGNQTVYTHLATQALTTSHTVDVPTSASVGDLLVAVYAHQNTVNGVLSAPAGWNINTSASASRGLGVATYPITNSSALSALGSTQTFGQASATLQARTVISIFRVTGTDLTANAADFATSNIAGNVSGVLTFPAMNPTNDGIVFFMVTTNNSNNDPVVSTYTGAGSEGIVDANSGTAGGLQAIDSAGNNTGLTVGYKFTQGASLIDSVTSTTTGTSAAVAGNRFTIKAA